MAASSASNAKYFLPLALWFLSQQLDTLGYDELIAAILKYMWFAILSIDVVVMIKLRSKVWSLEDDGTIVRVLKAEKRKRKKSSKTKKKKASDESRVATAVEADEVAKTSAVTEGQLPAPAPEVAAPSAAKAAPADDGPKYEELSVPAYDKREFSKLWTRLVIEALAVAFFQFVIQSSVSSLGLLFGMFSGPMTLLENGLIRLHLLGDSTVERPFDADKTALSAFKEQWDEARKMRDRAVKEGNADYVDPTEMEKLKALQERLKKFR